MKVSIVTPTYFRHNELNDYFSSIQNQTLTPFEVILVDGAPLNEIRSETLIRDISLNFNVPIHYFRFSGGTALQRNFGVSMAKGDLILFMDDDVRLDIDFLKIIVHYFKNDIANNIAGITGYRKNCFFDLNQSSRWILYRKLNLLKLFEPGFYDVSTGIPINNNGKSQFSGLREVDFMTTACTVYRKSVFDNIQLDPFFIGYGVLEDAQFSLRVKFHLCKQLFQCGDATCIEIGSPSGRSNRRIIAKKTVINYYYTFLSVFGPLHIHQKFRFFRFQLFEWLRSFVDIFRFADMNSFNYFIGKTKGLLLLIFYITINKLDFKSV
jgi:glycosyltransferase involved in cell wall biosynthesis